MNNLEGVLNQKKRRAWLADPIVASKNSLMRKSYSTPIFCDIMGRAMKCTIVFHASTKGSEAHVHLWERKHTRPLRKAERHEIDNIGKIPGTGWQGL